MSTAPDAPPSRPTDLLDGAQSLVEPAPETVQFGLKSRVLVPIIAAAAGIASALSGQEPTASGLFDAVLAFAFGFVVVWVGHRAGAIAISTSAALAMFFTGLQAVSYTHLTLPTTPYV